MSSATSATSAVRGSCSCLGLGVYRIALLMGLLHVPLRPLRWKVCGSCLAVWASLVLPSYWALSAISAVSWVWQLCLCVLRVPASRPSLPPPTPSFPPPASGSSRAGRGRCGDRTPSSGVLVLCCSPHELSPLRPSATSAVKAFRQSPRFCYLCALCVDASDALRAACMPPLIGTKGAYTMSGESIDRRRP